MSFDISPYFILMKLKTAAIAVLLFRHMALKSMHDLLPGLGITLFEVSGTWKRTCEKFGWKKCS